MNKYLKQLLDALAKKNAELTTIMTKSLDDGTTPNEEDEGKIAAIEADIAAIELNIERVKKQIQAIKDAEATGTPAEGADSQEGGDSAQGKAKKVEVKSNLEKGIGLALIVKAGAVAARSQGAVTAVDVLKSWNAPQTVIKALQQKALIGTTAAGGFAAPLVDLNVLQSEFIELLRAGTIVDKLAPGMRRVPFNIKMATQTGKTSVGWVGEAKTKQVTDMAFGNQTLTFAKVAGIVLLSDELVRFSSPAADSMVRDDMVKSVVEFLDNDFLDPTKAETTDSPAGIFNGVTAITATGVTPAAYDADLRTLRNKFITANVSLSGAYYVMSEVKASELADLRDALGNPYYHGMDAGVNLKTLKGIPVLESEAVGLRIGLIKPSEILLADDGGVDFATSNEATINMGTDIDPVWVNLFQNNLVAIRAERYIRWKKRRAQAAYYIQYS